VSSSWERARKKPSFVRVSLGSMVEKCLAAATRGSTVGIVVVHAPPSILRDTDMLSRMLGSDKIGADGDGNQLWAASARRGRARPDGAAVRCVGRTRCDA